MAWQFGPEGVPLEGPAALPTQCNGTLAEQVQTEFPTMFPVPTASAHSWGSNHAFDQVLFNDLGYLCRADALYRHYGHRQATGTAATDRPPGLQPPTSAGHRHRGHRQATGTAATGKPPAGSVCTVFSTGRAGSVEVAAGAALHCSGLALLMGSAFGAQAPPMAIATGTAAMAARVPLRLTTLPDRTCAFTFVRLSGRSQLSPQTARVLVSYCK